MHILLSDLAATQRFGSCVGASINKYAVIALEGPLGAGKTTLVKAVGLELGIGEVIVSPTFTMLNEYHSGRLPLFHLDIYRGGETGEIMDLDMLAMELEEMLAAGGVAMIEWPQYFKCQGRSFFEGRDYLAISLKYEDQSCSGKETDFGTIGEGEKKKIPEQRSIISQAVDNPANPQTFAGVLREDSPPEKYIKDGFTEARIATLSANGDQSADLLAKLSIKLGDMVINL
jgi:tRNA threonylcarbamoyladenosine biosynthesis protein TsaE